MSGVAAFDRMAIRLVRLVAAASLALPSHLAAAQQPAPLGARLSGVVTDAATGKPIAVEVTVDPGRRTQRTDTAGRFAFRELPAGSYVVRARALGFASAMTSATVRAGEEAWVALRLEPSVVSLRAVQTSAKSAERERFDRFPVPGVVSIGTAEILRLPSVGDADIVRAASLLPGISARNDFSAGFNVRGGEADQNLVLLDGIPIYNPFHLGGLFGTFIDAAVQRVDIFAGAFPAQYGGRLSSVFDVRSAADERPGVRTTSDVSLLSSSARVSGTVGGGRVSWNLAGRRTYADRLVNAVLGSNDFPYHFQDLQLHGLATLPRGGTLSLTAYAGRDELLTPSEDPNALLGGSGGSAIGFDWNNGAAGVLLTQPLGPHAVLEQRLSLGGFGTHFEIPAESLALGQQLREMRIAGKVQVTSGDHAINAGYDVSRYRTAYRERMTVGPDSLFGGDDPGDGRETTRQLTSSVAVFVEDGWKLDERVQLSPGLRAEWVPAAGWSGLSPRLSARFFLSEDLALTLAAGRYTQWMRAVRNEDLPIRVLDLWIASDSAVPVTSSTNLVLGLEKWLGSSRFVRVEGYGRRYGQLLEQASTIDPRIRPSLLRQFGGRSYGLDLYVRQLERGGFAGSLSYGYAVSIREFEGQTYFPAHDRRHNANLATSWTPGKGYTFGAHLAVASGTPYTGWAGYMQRWQYDPVTSTWTPGPASNDQDDVVRGRRNADRLPLYARFDLSAERSYQVGRAIVTPHVSVVNVLDRENVLLYSLDATRAPPIVRRFAQFPILPSVGVRTEFR